MSCCSTDKNVQLLRQQITANYQALHAEIENVSLASLPEGQIFIGDNNSDATPRSVSGDVTISSTGVTAITPGVITNTDVAAGAAIATTKLALDAINTKYSYLNGAGSYTIPFGARVVETDAELRAALLIGGTIFIKGTITLTNTIDINVTGTTLMGFNPEESKLIMSDTPTGATPLNIITPSKENITIKGLTIQGNNAVAKQNGITSQGSRVNSGLTIESCEIKKVNVGIRQSGAEGAVPNRNIRILNNRISDFYGGIYWDWTTIGLDVVGNTIIGDGSEYDNTKRSKWNAIWIGNGIMNLHVCNNNVGSVQRMGIEIFWPYRFNIDTAGTSDYSEASKQKADAGLIISGNTVYDCGSMGISCGGNRNGIIADNSISNVHWIGLELVGDQGQAQRPNKYVNMTVVGNSVYNVNAQPRGLGKKYKPTFSTTSTPIDLHYSSISSIDMSTISAGSVVTLNIAAPYPTLQVGKQIIARQTGALTTNVLTAVILTYNSTTGAMTATVVSKTGTDVVNTWTVFARRTLSFTLNSAEAMAWGTNAATATSGWSLNSSGQHVFEQDLNTLSISIVDLGVTGYQNQILGFLTEYNPTTQQAKIEVTAATGSYVGSLSNWKTFNYRGVNGIQGVSIDKMDGLVFANNTISTTVDGNPDISSGDGNVFERFFGTQIFQCRNVYVTNNLWTRCGKRYIFVNNAVDVIIENNKFLSPTNIATELGVALTRASSGVNAGSVIYDPTDPVTELGDEGSIACYFIAATRCIFRHNYLKGSSVAALHALTNGSEIYNHQFNRPEPRFGSSVKWKDNIVGNVDDNTLAINSPFVDISQRWINAAENFTGYRFHVDPGSSLATSKAFAVSVGAAKNIYNWFIQSEDTKTITVGTNVAFILFAAQNIPSSLFQAWFGPSSSNAIPVGTFIRGEVFADPTQYFEGRILSYNSGTVTFSCTVDFTTIPAATPNTKWKLYLDEDAFNVSKTGDLVLRKNVQADRTTGTKIGTSTSDKLSFWNATPAVQPANVAHATNATTVITQVNLVIDRLRALGLISSA